jgi:hypothetical protein
VRKGWAPRHPAFGDELERLECAHVRGDCVSPLLIEGDEIFIDPNTPAQPGDLVQFALSSRGVDAQNADLPPGQSPWKKGARWVKLLAPYRGIDMLLDKHGSSATATLLSCESPSDTPVLSPVRQVRRDGRLLFTPEVLFSTDAWAGQIAHLAATDNPRSEPADSFFHYGTWAGGTTNDVRAITSVTYQNPTAHNIDIEVTVIGAFWIDSADPAAVAHYVYSVISGGASYNESPSIITSSTNINTMFYSTVRTVTIAAGASITVTLNIRMSVSVGGTYLVPNANWEFVSISAIGMKK